MDSTYPKRILACIPAHNEAKKIGEIINKAKKYVTDVLVYDDGSDDNTDEVAKGWQALSSSEAREIRDMGSQLRLYLRRHERKRRT